MSDNTIKAVLETSKGTINIILTAEETPFTVANFVNLIKREYYDGLKFHRVIGDFMVQGGCPHGSGMGGPGYDFGDEFVPELRHDKPGILSMANAGPGTNGSQFFITHLPTPHLDDKHSVFGVVENDSDMDVVNSIKQGDQILKATVEGDIKDLMTKAEAKLKTWNMRLSRSFPKLPTVEY